uniref:UBX domain-containing protein 4 n=1 Tax=Graphocephala atropunctata TaxID=36148 RepID=A0A1B6LAU7_9HEMI
MVFHDIESITDVLAGQRIIIYYIEGKLTGIKRNDIKLCKNALEAALEMLEKKNEDILIIKILQGSQHFVQFDELYKPDVTGAATLFVVNNEGIPLMCEQINHADSVSNVMESLSTTCKLNRILNIDVSCLVSQKSSTQFEVEPSPNLKLDYVEVDKTVHVSKRASSEELPIPKSISLLDTEVKHECKVPEEHVSLPTTSQVPVSGKIDQNQSTQPTSTELRILLPNGNRVMQTFNKDALLQEVWVSISTTYKLEDFDLKTFNRQPFSEAEYKETLQNLNLYPNGVLFVVVKNIVPFSGDRSIGVFIYHGFQDIMARTTAVFQYIQGLVFWVWNSFFTRPTNNNRPGGNVQSGGHNRTIQSGSNIKSSSQKKSNKSASKPFSNVHTLHRNDDSDDENNRYNGNSTQQK